MELQEKIVDRWNESAKGYSGYIHMELQSFRVKAWTELIQESLPKGTLNILDVGTGPGFFSIVLSKAGHRVTSIDCCENMIQEAKANAADYGVTPDFRVMDSHVLAFPDNTFDAIVNRNVTWTLSDPQGAYAEWKRVLKPGGKLVIFDANWHMHYFDELLAKRIENAENEYRRRYGEEPFSSCEEFETEDYTKDTYLASVLRPDWDFKILKGLGYSRVQVDTKIIDRVYDEKEMLLYGYTPLFKIVATK